MQWKLSFLIGAPLVAIVLIASVVLIVWLIRNSEDGIMFSIFTAATALIIAIPTFFMTCFPLSSEYLQWRPVEGTVQAVDKRMVRDGDGMSERYVLQINGVPYGVDDTRAATLAEGDDVSLMCTREWQWAATPGYACRWNQ